MARARIVLVSLVALVVAVGLAFIARSVAAPPTVKATAPVAKPVIAVLVAARDLVPGERLDAASVTWRTWPTDAINPAYITSGASRVPAVGAAQQISSAAQGAATAAADAVAGMSAGPAAAVLGDVVRVPLVIGEPIIKAKLVNAAAGGVMAVTLDPGMRAMSIPVTTESAAGGFIQPGDHVDVVETRKLDGVAGPMGGPAGQNVVATTVMRNVRVMAIDQALRPSDKTAATPAATATLETTAAQAETLVLSRAQGDLTLVLRSYADGAGPPSEGAGAHGLGQAQASVVNVYRNGQVAEVRVAR